MYCLCFFLEVLWFQVLYLALKWLSPWWHTRSIAQLCLTLWGPVDCGLSDSSVHGVLQSGMLQWIAISFLRGSSWPRDWSQVSCIAGRFFTIWATSEAQNLALIIKPNISHLIDYKSSLFLVASKNQNKPDCPPILCTCLVLVKPPILSCSHFFPMEESLILRGHSLAVWLFQCFQLSVRKYYSEISSKCKMLALRAESGKSVD